MVWSHARAHAARRSCHADPWNCPDRVSQPAQWDNVALDTRAGVKYVLSNTNTNTNTFFSRVSNTNTNTPAKIWSNTNTNTNTAHQIQIQIQIHNEAETKLPPFYRWHIQIHCIVRRLFCLFKFHWKLFPKVQSTVISLHWFRLWLGAE